MIGNDSTSLNVRLRIPIPFGHMSFPVHIAHLFSANESEKCQGGGDHVVLRVPLEIGRIKREAGQTLCLWRRRKGQRWGGDFMEIEANRRPTCKRCLELIDKWYGELEVYPTPRTT